MKAVVLVAGYATRLYPLTKDRPKYKFKYILQQNKFLLVEYDFLNWK